MIITIGAFYQNFVIMVIGRTIFGVGSEFTFIVVPVLVTKWFAGREVAQALGISQCFPFIISASTGYIIPSFYEIFGLAKTFCFGVVFCLVSSYGGMKLNKLNK